MVLPTEAEGYGIRMEDLKDMTLYQARLIATDPKKLGGVQTMGVDEFKEFKQRQAELAAGKDSNPFEDD